MIAQLLFASAMMAAAPASSAGAILFLPQVTTTQPRIFLSDVADSKALPLQLRRLASQVEVARFEGGTAVQEISTVEIARRVRLRAPVLGHWLAQGASSSVVHVRFLSQTQTAKVAPAKRASARTCLQTRRSLAVGEVAFARDFDKVDCPADNNFSRTFRYDRNGSVQIVRAIDAQEITARFAGYDQDIVSPGQRMRMVSAAGSVSVARDVEALQSARQGTKVFVRSSDGAIFSLLYAGQVQ